ncbi:hypothetical protein BCR41DRAFT_358584 [Lobosporangium transversale]|uniref:J domain-containing protein n=1 Tax=Lobosporangium transversale TaxID=64571 RepID=A0A1Y2GGR9_9FUNG|nr:hypothetical protein BCR41DRAFT_358584 [Lobosporangium transversale]ORZ09357.1 hypothetical protein BCR41DRAFT_358584 [Lobosporangium transversale]|eukprot:XP_021878810.1 hypothetical protein BCR41DRAFT_358584 [Lobosporangium transversale]
MNILTKASKGLIPASRPNVLPLVALTTSKTEKTFTFHTSASQDSRSSHHSSKNHYEQLGLRKDATKQEIKSQFYKLSKLHHPDKNDSAESRKQFLSINEAYSVLGNERQRRDYDLTLLDGSGSLYSSSSSSERDTPNRGTLRRTPFRHSAHSAAAAAAARAHAATRAKFNDLNQQQHHHGPVPHFDSKSHQEMHHEQDIRREERRQARERAKAEQKKAEGSAAGSGIFLRTTLILVAIIMGSSLSKVFADEIEQQDKEAQSTLPPSYSTTTTTTSAIQSSVGRRLQHYGHQSAPRAFNQRENDEDNIESPLKYLSSSTMSSS